MPNSNDPVIQKAGVRRPVNVKTERAHKAKRRIRPWTVIRNVICTALLVLGFWPFPSNYDRTAAYWAGALTWLVFGVISGWCFAKWPIAKPVARRKSLHGYCEICGVHVFLGTEPGLSIKANHGVWRYACPEHSDQLTEKVRLELHGES